MRIRLNGFVIMKNETELWKQVIFKDHLDVKVELKKYLDSEDMSAESYTLKIKPASVIVEVADE